MTEDEAKTKWCPMMREPSPDVGRLTRCIGSACMMWRLGETEAIYPDGKLVVHVQHGYCGLAGKPQ